VADPAMVPIVVRGRISAKTREPETGYIMAARKIFVSHDYVNDANYRNLLVAWAKNRDFAFSMNDQSVDVSVDSTETVMKLSSRRHRDFTCRTSASPMLVTPPEGSAAGPHISVWRFARVRSI
jgi:hypothetical protein